MQQRHGGHGLRPCGAGLQRVAGLRRRRESLSPAGDGRDEDEPVSGVPGVHGGHGRGPSGGVKKGKRREGGGEQCVHWGWFFLVGPKLFNAAQAHE